MDFDWVLIGVGFVGLVAGIVLAVRGGFAVGSGGSVGSIDEVGE